jgi:hypothetical protein
MSDHKKCLDVAVFWLYRLRCKLSYAWNIQRTVYFYNFYEFENLEKFQKMIQKFLPL